MKYLIRKNKFLLLEQESVPPTSESQLKILVIDTNLAIDHALRFAQDGHQVFYYLANLSAFPKLEDSAAGDGFRELTKIDDYGQVLKEVDLVYITDNCFPQLAIQLRDQGIRVYGPSPELARWENDRIYAFERMRKLGIATPNSKMIKGSEELRKFLRDKCDGKKSFFIKINKLRGNIETFSVKSEDEAVVLLSQAGFGPYINELEFLVQYECDGVEIGVDAYIAKDRILRPYAYTIEEKGRGNIAKWVRESEFESRFYDPVLPIAKDDDYRCNLSIEGFWDGKDLKVIDVTSRNPYPVSSLYPRFIKNWTEVIMATADGKAVEVQVGAPYMMEVTISTDNTDLWRVIDFPESLLKMPGDGIGFRRVVKKADQYWYVPGDGLVATINVEGDSPEECEEKAIELLDEVKAISIQYDATFFKSIKDKIAKLRELGDSFKF